MHSQAQLVLRDYCRHIVLKYLHAVFHVADLPESRLAVGEKGQKLAHPVEHSLTWKKVTCLLYTKF